MKKTVLLFMFFCVSVLCCLAQEQGQIGENNDTLPLFSYSGLSAQTFGFGFSTVTPVLNTSSPAWKQTDLGLTRYADYGEEPFFSAAKPVFQWGLIIGGGIVMAMAGILSATTDGNNSNLNIVLFAVGLTATAGGIVWKILD